MGLRLLSSPTRKQLAQEHVARRVQCFQVWRLAATRTSAERFTVFHRENKSPGSLGPLATIIGPAHENIQSRFLNSWASVEARNRIVE